MSKVKYTQPQFSDGVMSKELEALDTLYKRAKLFIRDIEIDAKNNSYLIAINDNYGTIKKALTPPTADDVVKALNESSVLEHKYSNGLFYYKSIIDERWYIISFDSLFNQPHLITMIGRFYDKT